MQEQLHFVAYTGVNPGTDEGVGGHPPKFIGTKNITISIIAKYAVVGNMYW